MRAATVFLLFLAQLTQAQTYLPWYTTAVPPDTSDFAFIAQTSTTKDMSTGHTTDTMKIVNVSQDSTHTCLIATVGVFDWADIEIDSVVCADNGTKFAVEVIEEDGGGEEAGIFYLKDSELPSGDSVEVVVYASDTPDFVWGLLFYSGVDQDDPLWDPDSTQNCGWNAVTTTTGTTDMSWSWTNNACHIHCVTTVQSAKTGSEAIDMLLNYVDGTSHIIGSGQTQNWMQEDVSGLDCDGMSSRE
jgi:hypothetical protein